MEKTFLHLNRVMHRKSLPQNSSVQLFVLNCSCLRLFLQNSTCALSFPLSTLPMNCIVNVSFFQPKLLTLASLVPAKIRLFVSAAFETVFKLSAKLFFKTRHSFTSSCPFVWTFGTSFWLRNQVVSVAPAVDCIHCSCLPLLLFDKA